jgi:hypothetical protein
LANYEIIIKGFFLFLHSIKSTPAFHHSGAE